MVLEGLRKLPKLLGALKVLSCRPPKITLPKTNIAPKNDGFQQEPPFPGCFFSGVMLVSGRVTNILPSIFRFHVEFSRKYLKKNAWKWVYTWAPCIEHLEPKSGRKGDLSSDPFGWVTYQEWCTHSKIHTANVTLDKNEKLGERVCFFNKSVVSTTVCFPQDIHISACMWLFGICTQMIPRREYEPWPVSYTMLFQFLLATESTVVTLLTSSHPGCPQSTPGSAVHPQVESVTVTGVNVDGRYAMEPDDLVGSTFWIVRITIFFTQNIGRFMRIHTWTKLCIYI